MKMTQRLLNQLSLQFLNGMMVDTIAELRDDYPDTNARSLVGLRQGIVTVVLLDPPRKGCEPALLRAVAEMAPRRVVYISCDPATLARDLKLLREAGYEARCVAPVDMFPRTGHVECAALLTREMTL